MSLQMSRLPNDSPTVGGDVASCVYASGARSAPGRAAISPLPGTHRDVGHLLGARLSAKFRSNRAEPALAAATVWRASLEIIRTPVTQARATTRGGSRRLAGRTGTDLDLLRTPPCRRSIRRSRNVLPPRVAAAPVPDRWRRRIAASYGACLTTRLFLLKTGYDPRIPTSHRSSS